MYDNALHCAAVVLPSYLLPRNTNIVSMVLASWLLGANTPKKEATMLHAISIPAQAISCYLGQNIVDSYIKDSVLFINLTFCTSCQTESVFGEQCDMKTACM